MSKIENEYNKRFKNEAFQDDDFDVEGLWDAIEPEIRKKKDRKVFAWILFGLILLGATSIFLFNKKSKTIEDSIIAETVLSKSSNTQTNNVLEVVESTERILESNLEKLVDSKTKSVELKEGRILSKNNNNIVAKKQKCSCWFSKQ